MLTIALALACLGQASPPAARPILIDAVASGLALRAATPAPPAPSRAAPSGGAGEPAAAPAPVLRAQDAVPAVPLPRRALPADTAFVLHFDARTFFASSWWGALDDRPEVIDALSSSDELRMLRQQLGLDPFQDLLSVTVLGRDDKGNGAAVLVRTTARTDQALETLRSVEVHTAMQADGLDIDRWGDEGDGVFGSFYATPDGDRVAILGRTTKDVARVVRAAEGGLPRLADTPRPAISAAPRPGTFWYLEVGLPLRRALADTPVARIANGVERLTIELGEHDGEVFAELKVRATDRDVARRIADVLNGARALVANFGLVDHMPFALQDLYDGLIAEVQGSDVRVGVELPARDLAYMLEELSELR